jgi:tripartite-type tricarboxylate transporter receptor subunit TctC
VPPRRTDDRASSGNGSIQHIAGELFKQLTGTFITHIPYRGAGPAVQGLMGGQVSPAQRGEFTRKELDYWGKVIKSSKFTAE